MIPVVPTEKVLHPVTHRRTGRLPAKSDTRALFLNRFAALEDKPPERTNFWPRRAAFPVRTFGNLDWGDCTIAKQAQAALRMERFEQRRTVDLTDEEIIRVYQDLSFRLYGGGDNGAYETDALDNWRRPDLTFKDTRGRPYTIDAYLRLNPFDHEELRRAMWLAKAKGLAVCLNLPWIYAAVEPPADWDFPPGQSPIGPWAPGSWGGHSMWARDYDEVGIWLVHTWGMPDQRITWRAAAVYLDEAHLVVDSVNAWRARLDRSEMNLPGLVEAVNRVSSQKIAT